MLHLAGLYIRSCNRILLQVYLNRRPSRGFTFPHNCRCFFKLPFVVRRRFCATGEFTVGERLRSAIRSNVLLYSIGLCVVVRRRSPSLESRMLCAFSFFIFSAESEFSLNLRGTDHLCHHLYYLDLQAVSTFEEIMYTRCEEFFLSCISVSVCML